MNQLFPNTSLIHGSIDGGIGTTLTQNISWQYNENPWNYPGASSDNQTHLGCLTNNATLQQICCGKLNGTIIENRIIVDNATASNGGPLWCALPEMGNYLDPYNSEPALVNSWAQCYNSSVTPENNPGIFTKAITTNSDVWQCELQGNFSGSNSFRYPYFVTTPNSASSTQAGRFSLLAMAGVISVAVLAASSSCKLSQGLTSR